VASTTQYEGLFIATPERVSLAYQLSGLGSRSVAQLIDVLLLTVALVALLLAISAARLGSLLGNLLTALLVFAILNGYFVFFEGLWSGQTPGKRVMRLRVVSEAGQPITFEQSLTRNLVRNFDFIPFGYGIGLVALFANGRGKRLGDLAAGTVVVRERPGVSLGSLVAMSRQALAAQATAKVPEAGVAGESAYVRQRTVRDLEPATDALDALPGVAGDLLPRGAGAGHARGGRRARSPGGPGHPCRLCRGGHPSTRGWWLRFNDGVPAPGTKWTEAERHRPGLLADLRQPGRP